MTDQKRWPLVVLLAAFLLAWLPPFSGAADFVERQDAAPGTERMMDADAAAAAVRQATGGKVLRVEPSQRDGNPSYRVRVLLDDGRVRVLSVDATTGRLSE